MKKVSLCVPCYNEEKNIYLVYNALTSIMRDLPQYDYEIIFEDNASTDNSEELFRELANKDKRVKVIFNTRNFGASRSGKNCCYSSTGDVVISIAADLQNPVSMIPEFLKYWEQGYLVVMGQKVDSKEFFIKKNLRQLYYKIIQICSDIPQIPNITGFGAIDATVFRKICRMEEPDMSIRHILTELGYEIKLIPYTQEKRINGKSSYHIWQSLDFSISSLIHTSYIPLRAATITGTLLTVISFLILLGYVIASLIKSSLFHINTALLLLICLLGAVQILFIGFAGEYLYETLQKVRKRELVIERERINFGDEKQIKDEI